MSAVATMLTERPIIFSGQMVRAILEGRKTQTRRVMKPQLNCFQSGKPVVYCGPPGSGKVRVVRNPYGNAGDSLWVKETVRFKQGLGAVYEADGTPAEYLKECESIREYMTPVLMPRRGSRLSLEIIGIRIERVQSITDADAMAEGLIEWSDPPRISTKHYGLGKPDVWEQSPRDAFARIWDQINGKKHPWSMNCWVWCISFRSLTEPNTGEG